jgi:hypothetical protein
MDPSTAGRRLATLADELGARNEDRDANYYAVARLLRFKIRPPANAANEPKTDPWKVSESID